MARQELKDAANTILRVPRLQGPLDQEDKVYVCGMDLRLRSLRSDSHANKQTSDVRSASKKGARAPVTSIGSNEGVYRVHRVTGHS